MPSFTILLFATLAILFSFAHGMYTPTGAMRAADITGKMQWQGLSKGQNVTLYGTAGEILGQLKAADPNWVPANHDDVASAKITKRSQDGHAFCCPVSGQSWNPVSIESLQVALDHLNQIGGTCAQGANSCAVATEPSEPAACVEGAGIHICNDNPANVYMTCASIAAYALDLIEQCPSTEGRVCGQIFDTAKYNVVLSQC